MNHVHRSWLIILGLLMSCLIEAAPSSTSDFNQYGTLENLTIQHAWPDIYAELKAQDSHKATTSCDLNSIKRLIFAHASLATGHSSNAVRLFYCAKDQKGSTSLNEWRNWTSELAGKYPDTSKAHYVFGDALARTGEYRAAIDAFTQAIDLDAKNTLALNARGVARFVLYLEQQNQNFSKELDNARDDWVKSSKIAPNLSNSYVNRAISGLVAAESIDYAISNFDRALKKEPNFQFAKLGKAVAHGSKGEFARYKKYLGEVEKKSPDTPFVKPLQTVAMNAKGNGAGGRGTISTGFSLSGNVGIKLPFFDKIEFGNISMQYKMDIDVKRGGIYMYLKNGENLVTTDGKLEQVGIWFTLNYPLRLPNGESIYEVAQ